MALNQPRKALMACSQHWTSPYQVGSHHIARVLARRGWRVAYISFPISPWHLLANPSRTRIGERFQLYRHGGIVDEQGSIWAYTPGSLAAPYNAPLLSSRWVHANWQRLTFPNLVARLLGRGFGDVDLVYFDNPYQNFWLDAVRWKRSVYRLTDDYSIFPYFVPAAARQELVLAGRTDLVAYPTTRLRARAEQLGSRRMVHLPNGVDFDALAGGSREMPDEYQGLSRPIAVYIGTIPEWFDFGLLAQAARALPAVTFVLIGTLSGSRPDGLPDNVRLIGPRPHRQLPRYLHNADVGIIPFAVERYPAVVNALNPLKLYEYLACGLPVVATSWQELRDIDPPATLCRTPAQFIEGIALATRQRPADGPLRAFARRADWDSRIGGIWKILMGEQDDG